MADYCTTDDVQDIMPGIGTFTDTTKPTLLQVEGYITSVSAHITGVVKGAGYVTPVTDTDALQRLLDICAHGVAAMVMRGIRGRDAKEAEAFETIYQQGLDCIRDGEVVGLTVDTTAATYLPRSRYTTHPTDPDTGADYPTPTFKFGTRQW